MTRHEGDATRAGLLAAIIRYIAEHSFAPSYRDLQGGHGLASISSVNYHLRRLRADGFITYEDGLPRTIVVTKVK